MLSEIINPDTNSESISPLILVVRENEKKLEKNALINRPIDFWFLGGLSFVAWIISEAAFYGFNANEGTDRHILSWPQAFILLSVVCNYPHFLSAYRIAYGNGIKKILNHWFTLLVVPLILGALFYSAYHWRAIEIEKPYFKSLDVGSDLLRAGVWLMWLTVGWHYAKQAFGIMLRYASFDGYPLSKIHRTILKVTLLAIVPPNFLVMISQMDAYGAPSFQDLPMTVFHIPKLVILFSYLATALTGLLFLASAVQIYVKHKKLPSINFLTPLAVFYLWWFPGFWPLPYSMIMVPFFHSLQYLPFAYQRVEGDLSARAKSKFSTTLTVTIIGMLVLGVAVFDLVPTWLDDKMESRFNFGSSFFAISGLLFFNIHHYFVDSSIWRSRKAKLST